MTAKSENDQLRKLRAENERLRHDNKRLREQPPAHHNASRSWTALLKKIGVVICVVLAVVLLALGNLLFWAGNTLVKSDRYVAATAPIIRNPQVQQALATSISQKLFSNVNVEAVVQDALPPRADFLAPTIATQVEQHTDDAILKILQRPQFQERWNNAQLRAHDRFISLVDKHGSDGSINIGEVYTDVSQQLQGTKLAFLANKPLPAKVGRIQLVSGGWLSILQKTIQNIDTWRIGAILLLVLFSALGVWLSKNRRKTVLILGTLFAVVAFLTLIGIRIGNQAVGNRVDPQYAAAAKATYGIVIHSLVIQTRVLFFAALAMVFIAWISGTSAASQAFKVKVSQVFSGRLHEAIFTRGENNFTRWIGAHKSLLQWLIVIVVALSVLFTRLTPTALIIQFICLLVLVLVVEILAAKTPDSSTR